MKPQNIKEAKALIERYRSITLEEINAVRESETFDLDDVPSCLTGFGSRMTCSLCIAVGASSYNIEGCKECIYNGYLKCTKHKTYKAIGVPETAEKLLKAFRNRADYIETLIKDL